jgi:hypothetical protein
MEEERVKLRILGVLIAVLLLSGCGHMSPYFKDYRTFNSPSSLDELLSKSEELFGEQNIHKYRDGQIIDIHIRGLHSLHCAEQLGFALQDLSRRKGYSVTQSNTIDFYGVPIEVGGRARLALSIINKDYEPSYVLKSVKSRYGNHSRKYRDADLLSIPFGWQIVGQFKKSADRTKNIHVVILREEFYEEIFAEHRQRTPEYKAKYKENAQRSYEALKQRLEEKQQHRQAVRENARSTISQRQNIGKQIRKNGMLTYQEGTGILIFGVEQLRDHSESGQIVAQLEDFSQDGYRIKFRVLNFATPRGRLSHPTVDYPFMDKYKIQPGMVYWDDVDNWVLHE